MMDSNPTLLDRTLPAGGKGPTLFADPTDTEIMRQRSRQAAERTLEIVHTEAFSQVIVVRRADTLIGIPIAAVATVRAVDFTALPFSTEIVNGLFQIRGQAHCVIDIAPFFGPAEQPVHGERILIILVSGAPGSLGIRIDEVLGPRLIEADELASDVHGGRVDFVTHVTRDMIQIIDINLLVSLPAIRTGKKSSA